MDVHLTHFKAQTHTIIRIADKNNIIPRTGMFIDNISCAPRPFLLSKSLYISLSYFRKGFGASISSVINKQMVSNLREKYFSDGGTFRYVYIVCSHDYSQALVILRKLVMKVGEN